MLRVLDSLPADLLDLEATQLHRLFDGPTLIDLPGRSDDYVYVATLLHGNEHSGHLAMQQVLRSWDQKSSEKGLLYFIANPQAAKASQRHLDTQPDFNRIWKKKDHDLVSALMGYIKGKKIKAVVDIHNNTGKNPLYSCVSDLDRETLRLAQVFSSLIVYFRSPDSAHSVALSEFFPSVTIECGLSADPEGVEKSVAFIEALLSSQEWDSDLSRLDIRHTMARVLIPRGVSYSFGENKDADLCFDENVDQWNFQDIAPGTLFANRQSQNGRIQAIDNDGHDISKELFVHEGGRILFRRRCFPSMITKDRRVIEQDCFGYLMESYPTPSFDP